MGREKAPDEVFCRACGARIKEAAELCPECGVRNTAAGAAGSNAWTGGSGTPEPAGTGTGVGGSTRPVEGGKPGKSGAVADRNTGAGVDEGTASRGARGDTVVSDSWWYGVALCLGLWIVLLVWISTELGPIASAVAGVLLIFAWMGLPFAAYYDMKYVRHNSEWQPNAGLWVVGLLVWVLNIVLAAIYLYRRREVLGVP